MELETSVDFMYKSRDLQPKAELMDLEEVRGS